MDHTQKQGYKDITVTDFPIRGTQAQRTFRCRYGEDPRTKKLIANTIPLISNGTKLEKEFGDFLKDEGGRRADIPRLNRDRLLSPAEGSGMTSSEHGPISYLRDIHSCRERTACPCRIMVPDVYAHTVLLDKRPQEARAEQGALIERLYRVVGQRDISLL